MTEHDSPPLQSEGVIVYTVADREEAYHLFEHTLGLTRTGEDGEIVFFDAAGTTVAVHVSGEESGAAPYLVFSSGDLVASAEHFLHRGFQVRPLPWAPEGGGFLARSPEGHGVAVVDERLLEDEPET
jgi:hypothetical protein